MDKKRSFNMKILVTGGAGFIGSHLVEALAAKGHSVKVIDDLSNGKLENLFAVKDKITFIQGSVTDAALIDKEMKNIDYVFALAAIVSVPLSIKNPKKCFEVNTLGNVNVIEAAKKYGVKKIIFASSAAVYGDNDNLPLKEEEKPKPMSPYAIAKLDVEHLLANSGVSFAALRYFNVDGPRQDPNSPYSGVISIFEERAKNGKDLVIYGDGSATRDFIHVKDIVRASLLAMEKGKMEGIFNVASGREKTIKELAEEIIKKHNSKSKIVLADEREGDIKRSVADISKIKKMGF